MSDDLVIPRASLGSLEQINKGGTAVIYGLPDLSPADLGVVAEGLAFKAYTAATRRAAGPGLRPGLRSLVAFREHRLDLEQRRDWDREINWPVRVVADDDGEAAGIVMPLIPFRFHQRILRRNGPPTLAPREVNMLFGDAETMRRIGLSPVRIDVRMRMVRRTAGVFRRMHEHNVVAGDISARNLVYDVAGDEPAVLAIDADSARVAGTRSAFSGQPHTPHWQPPEALAAERAYLSSGGAVRLDARTAQSMRTDVYKFGLLVIRVLDYGRQRSVNRDPARALGVLRRQAGAQAAEMLTRTMSERPADRPTMAEWCEVLHPEARRPTATGGPAPGGRLGNWVYVEGHGWERRPVEAAGG